MKKLFLLPVILFLLFTRATAQSGILEVSGSIRLGNTSDPNPPPGTIRWTGTDFEGFTGLFWLPISSTRISAFPSDAGIGATLEVRGAIQIGNTHAQEPKPGTIRWTGGDFQVCNGVFWMSLTKNLLVDIDGNAYRTVVIGTQEWMMENLRTATYNDTTPLPQVIPPWSTLTTGAFCWYDNDPISSEHVYGKLYNWYAVASGKLCPVGWRVPTQADWIGLATFLGGAGTAGGAMKETGLLHWNSPNTGATDSSGFNALPGGARSFNGSSFGQKQSGLFWSQSSDLSGDAWQYSLNAGSTSLSSYLDDKRVGTSVRCIKE